MSKPEFFVDVAKQHLDVAFAGEDIVWRVSHDAAGLTELCARLAAARASADCDGGHWRPGDRGGCRTERSRPCHSSG